MESPYMYGRYVMMPPPVQPSSAQPQPPQTISKGDYYYHQYVSPSHPTVNVLHGNALRNCFQNASGWTGVPLISNVVRRPKKPNGNNQSGLKNSNSGANHRMHPTMRHIADYDENALTRLVVHTQGIPLTQSNTRNRVKMRKPSTPNEERTNATVVKNAQNYLKKIDNGQCILNNNYVSENNNNINSSHCNGEGGETGSANESCAGMFTVFNANEESCGTTQQQQQNQMVTSLPRIIKPRKRRKKERKPATAGTTAHDLLAPADAINAIDINSNHILIGKISTSENVLDSKRVSPNNRGNDNASNNNNNNIAGAISDTISCSCRICDPFCKIWAFPLKKSCSDPTASMSGLHTAELTDRVPNPDVGVIGSHRTMGQRNEWRTSLALSPSNSSLDSKFSNEIGTRKNSFSDSGDSGCDILSGLHLATDFLNNIDDIAVIDSPTPPSIANNIYNFVDAAATAAFVDTVNDLSNEMINGMQFKCDFLPPAECLINVNTIFESW